MRSLLKNIKGSSAGSTLLIYTLNPSIDTLRYLSGNATSNTSAVVDKINGKIFIFIDIFYLRALPFRII